MAGGVLAVGIADVPQMDTGAPTPIVLAEDGRVVLSYRLRAPLAPEPVTGSTSAYICFEGVSIHSLGGPNDETLHGHPLWEAGLRQYSAFIIENSPLIESLERMNSVHPFHKPERFLDLRHYIFTFHDSTFECVARSFSLTTSAEEFDSERVKLMQTMMRAHTQTT